MRFRPTLFWDVDPETIDVKKNARYIIERILDFGTDDEVRWMWQQYPRPLLSDVVKRSRDIRPISRNFWRLVFKAMDKVKA